MKADSLFNLLHHSVQGPAIVLKRISDDIDAPRELHLNVLGDKRLEIPHVSPV